MKGEKYEARISSAFHSVFEKNKDHLHSVPNNTHLSIADQEEILFRQYPLEKKGKNFNTKESRTFRIDEGVLKQIKKNGQQRTLPDPIKVKQ